MTDFKKTILLEVDIDNSDAERRMAQLTQEIEKLKTANKENTKETQAQRVEVEKNNVAIKAAQQEYNNLKSTLVSNTNAAKANKGSYTELYNQWKQAEAQLKNMAGAFQKNEQGVVELTQEYYDQSKAVDDLKKNLLLFNAGISQGNLNVGNYGNTLEGMRNQLRDMEAALQQIEVGSVAFTEAKEKIDDMKVSLQQAEGVIDSAGNRVAKNKLKDGFQDAQGAAQALTGAVGLLSLAMGTDSKAGETLRKVMIGVTVAQTALTIAKSKDDIIGTALIIKNKALAVSQGIYTAAVGLSTGALKAFRVALLATGIGAAIAAIALLISRMNSLKGSTDENTEAAEKFAEAQQKSAEAADKFASSLAQQNEGKKRLIELRKAEGASADEILRLNKELLEDERVGVNQAIETAKSIELKIQLQDRLFAITNELKILDAEYYKQQEENRKKRDEEILKSRQSATEQIEIFDTWVSNSEILINDFKNLLTALYGEEVVNGLLDFNEAAKEQESILKGVATATENIAIADAKANAEKQALNATTERQVEVVTALAKQMGVALADVLTDSEDKIKDFNKSVLLMTIKALKAQVDIAISAIIARELSTKGFVGIVSGAILTGLVEAAFGVAINSIEGFATGGKIKGGTPIQRSNGDNVLITAKKGEVIMNEGQQRKLQSVAGRDVFSKLGIPGFDTGGVIGNGINTTVNSSLSLAEMRSINKFMREMPPPVLQYSEFDKFKQRVEFAERAGSLA